jgi:alkanesulfonate monooxygenase SsuD/methylene tetrahydromethanopterin reductase-like flavin-dependent oxidoreductase (luciferase family)
MRAPHAPTVPGVATGNGRMRPSTILGTVEEAIEQLRELEAAGLTRIMGQHLLHRDLDAIALVGPRDAPRL